MTGFRLAWSFLTRLPGGMHPDDDNSMASSLTWFPVVGLVLGALAGAVYWSLAGVLTPLTAAFVALALAMIVTGGFHEDGLADSADSFGGYTRERRLEIMHDSRVGTFGVLALVVAIGAKASALASLSARDGMLALVIAHGIARASAVGVMGVGPEARTDGLAATAGTVPRVALAVAATTAVVVVGLGPTGAGAVGAVAASALVGLSVARRHLGGTTGDVLGAVEQVGEVVALVVVSALVTEHGWSWA